MSRSRTAVRLDRVHRGGAATLGSFLLVFAIVGFAHQVPMVSTGERVLGLYTNGALSIISLVVGAVLLVSAMRSARSASTLTGSLGALFLLSGLLHLALINTSLNLLSFGLSNIFFSLVVGIALLGIGAYGRLAGNKPPDSPYRRRRAGGAERSMTSEDLDLMDAERAIANDTATPEQQQKVYIDAIARQTKQYSQAWRNFARDHSRAEVDDMRSLERSESAHPERADRPEPGRMFRRDEQG